MLSTTLLAGTLLLASPAYVSDSAALELDSGGDLSADFPTHEHDTQLDDSDYEPDWQRRGKRGRRKRKGRYKPKYRKRDRTLGFSLQSGIAIPIGKTVSAAFGIGPMVTGRFQFHLGDSAVVYIDVRWSYRVLKDPRPLFFRTAETDASTSGGTMHTLTPAVFYGYAIPLGYGYQSRASVNPKLYFGIGPDFTFSQAFVTAAGTKGTVQGEGTQAFLAFIPGLGVDIRLNEFFFLGIDARYHVTIPLARPSLQSEFTLPNLQVFEAGAALSFYFY